jgi:CheY-like chemotaxis protein
MAVDDVPMNLELVAFGLGRQGHTVATFSSARAALDNLSAGNRYDVILMDVQMPDMDGLAATREIRSMSGPVAQTPIIALTANVLPEQINECLQAGMTAHAPKPINIDELEKTVRRHGRSGINVAEAMDTATSVDALTAKYADYLAGVPGELSKILEQPDHASVLEDIRRLSHAVAGSAGSFGFREVSDAAFALEAVAERIQETGESLEDLAPSVSRFIDSAEKAVA